MWAPIAAAVGKKLAGNRGLNIGSSTREQLRGLRAGPKPIKGGGFGLVSAVLAQRKAQQAAQARAQQQNEAAQRQYEYDRTAHNMRNNQLNSIREYQQSTGPQQDWLGDFYRTYNIGGQGGSLDQKARDYWSGEAKTKGRSAVMDIIRGTAKAQGTWGGRSNLSSIARAKAMGLLKGGIR